MTEQVQSALHIRQRAMGKKCKMGLQFRALFVISSGPGSCAQVLVSILGEYPGGQRGIGIPIGDVLTDVNKWHGAAGGGVPVASLG